MNKKETTKPVTSSNCLAEELFYSHCGFLPQKLLLDIHDFKMLMYTKLIWGKKIRVTNLQAFFKSRPTLCFI